MRLSYIIPLFNAENYIHQCLNSICNQPIDKKDFEIIVIDDGSKDESFLRAKEIAKQNDNIKVYHQENKGVSETRNRGIDLAKGNYIWFIDSDDYIISDTSNLLINCIEKYNLDILEFKMIRTKSRILNKPINNTPSSDIKVLSGKVYASSFGYNESCCTSLYRRAFLLNTKIRFVEGKIMEDMVFNAEIVPLSNRIAYYPLNVYRYVINPKSIWTNKEPKALRKSIEDFIFMTKKISSIIKAYELNNIDTRIIKSKQQEMLYNITKRLLISNYKTNELNTIIKDLTINNIYPLQKYKGDNFYRKIETFLFNRKFLFLITVSIYRLFKSPIDNFIIKRYQRKKEKLIKSIIVKY